MLTQLLLKQVAGRLAGGGACPYDRHCVHASAGRCEANAETLRERKAQIEAKRIREETRKPCTAFMEMDANKPWPCAGRLWTILLPPEHARQG